MTKRTRRRVSRKRNTSRKYSKKRYSKKRYSKKRYSKRVSRRKTTRKVMVGGADIQLGDIFKYVDRNLFGIGSYQQRRVFIRDDILCTQKVDDEQSAASGLNLALNTVTGIRLRPRLRSPTAGGMGDSGYTIEIDHPGRSVLASLKQLQPKIGSEDFRFPTEEERNHVAETIADYTRQTYMMVRSAHHIRRGVSLNMIDESLIERLQEGTRVVALDAFHITITRGLSSYDYTRVLVAGKKGYVDTEHLRHLTAEESEEAALTQVATQQEVGAPDMVGAAAAAPTKKNDAT